MRHLQSYQIYTMILEELSSDKFGKVIEQYYQEIIKNKLNSIGLSGYFPNLSAYRLSLFDSFVEVYNDLYNNKRVDILEKYLKTLLGIEMQLNSLKSSSNDTKRDKMSTKQNTLSSRQGEDPFSKSKKSNEGLLESKLSLFSKTLDRMKMEMKSKPSTEEKPQIVSKEKPIENVVQTKYKKLLQDWKENQRKLGKNTSPGQGTRARLMKMAQQQ
jgi:hypothetical protein